MKQNPKNVIAGTDETPASITESHITLIETKGIME